MLTLRLAHDAAVPVHADRRKVAELLGLGAGPGTVQILHPHQEPPPGGAGEQPRQDGRPKVAHVQFAGGTGGEAAAEVMRLAYAEQQEPLSYR